jgi:hypothetical protein
MLAQVLLFSFLLAGLYHAGRLVQRRGRSQRHGRAEEKSLWGGLAAGLFEADDASAGERMEIALSALSRKLGLRAAMVTRHGRDHCAVVATAGEQPLLLRGLGRGSVVARSSVFCGSVREGASSLAIDYASLSEWRSHPALRERGWESYLGVACGKSSLVVSFFDSRPRAAPFTRAERALVEQFAPWLSAVAASDAGRASPTLPIRDTQTHS